MLPLDDSLDAVATFQWWHEDINISIGSRHL